jgi:hypothetical protein
LAVGDARIISHINASSQPPPNCVRFTVKESISRIEDMEN